VRGFAFVVELLFLEGRKRLLEAGVKPASVFSLLRFAAGE